MKLCVHYGLNDARHMFSMQDMGFGFYLILRGLNLAVTKNIRNEKFSAIFQNIGKNKTFVFDEPILKM